MKKKLKIINIALAIVLALLIGTYCTLRFGFSKDIFDRSGWSTEDGAVRYLDYYGRPCLGWQYVDGKLYYFTADEGIMATGWAEIDGSRYYFGTAGVRLAGWQEINGETYYLQQDGKQVTGWQQVQGETFYFTETGAMATGWAEIDGNRHYFSPEGKALTGWQTIDSKRYYLTPEGKALTGWAEAEGVRCLFDADGAAISGWFEDESGKYFLNEGVYHTGWQDLDGSRYHFGQNGVMTVGWLTEDTDRYYLQSDGKMAVGETVIDNVKTFFTSKGKYVLLCNSGNAVPADYKMDLVWYDGFQIDSSCREAFAAMLKACRAAGYGVTVNNTYRSKAEQQYLWDRRVKEYMNAGMSYSQACAKTGESIAIPGHSEHQTGLAADLNGSDATYAWLAANCWDYGFILRYPSGCYNHTKIIYEPWHFRYVGTELSLELESLNICLEEYMANLSK